jgi:putative addiction module component (TIGR02574 family)
MTDFILDAIKQLSVDERIELVARICNTIEQDSRSGEVSAEIRDELDRRLAAMEADPKAGLTFDEFKALLRRSA